MLEAQFINFLVDRTESKVSDITQHSSDATIQSLAGEIQLYIKQLRSVLEATLSTESTPSAPKQTRQRKPRHTNDTEEA